MRWYKVVLGSVFSLFIFSSLGVFPVKAGYFCAPSAVIQRFQCGSPISPPVGDIYCADPTNNGQLVTVYCNTDLTQNPSCSSNLAECSSNDTCSYVSYPYSCSCSNSHTQCWQQCTDGTPGCTGGSPPEGGGGNNLNCSNVTVNGSSTLTTLTKNQSYTLGADYTSYIGPARRIMSIIPGTNCNSRLYWQESVGGTGTVSFSNTWTPTEAGSYTIYCLSSVLGAESCSGYASCIGVDQTNYACPGPGASMTVNVVEPQQNTCTISSIDPTSVVSGTVGSTTVTYSGTVNSAQDIRLWLERRDGTQVPGGTSLLTSSDQSIGEYAYGGTY